MMIITQIAISNCLNNIIGDLVTQDFSFQNYDNQIVSKEIFNDKVVITDFFFTTCPSICYIMKRQMFRIYEGYPDQPDLLLFSHTVEILKNYSEELGIKTEKWELVTGPQDEIFEVAKTIICSMH